MGQYQQWLLYQEIDRRLRAQLKDLEAQLAQLQDRANLLEQSCPSADNVIIRALVDSMLAQRLAAAKRHTGEHIHSPAAQQQAAQRGAGPLPALHTNGDASSPPTVHHSEIVLLPEEATAAFEDKQPETPPELPAWLHNILLSSVTDSTRPTDQESIRTNRLVQRWLERWGRHSSLSAQQPEAEEGPFHE